MTYSKVRICMYVYFFDPLNGHASFTVNVIALVCKAFTSLGVATKIGWNAAINEIKNNAAESKYLYHRTSPINLDRYKSLMAQDAVILATK